MVKDKDNEPLPTIFGAGGLGNTSAALALPVTFAAIPIVLNIAPGTPIEMLIVAPEPYRPVTPAVTQAIAPEPS